MSKTHLRPILSPLIAIALFALLGLVGKSKPPQSLGISYTPAKGLRTKG